MTDAETLANSLAALHRDATLDEIAHVAVQALVSVLSADAAGLAIAGEDGRFKFRAVGGPLGPELDQARVHELLLTASSERRLATLPGVADADFTTSPARLGQPFVACAIPCPIDGHPTAILAGVRWGAMPPEKSTLDLLATFGSGVGLAIDRAHLYQSERRARAEVETAKSRLAFLTEASAAFASSLDERAILRALADLSAPYLAHWCLVDVQSGSGAVYRAASKHADPSRSGLLDAMNRSSGSAPPSRNHPIVTVWRTGSPAMLSPLSEEVLLTIARGPDQVATMKGLGADSALILPIAARGRTFGTLSLIRGDPANRFDAGDLALAEELVRRAALATDNARLYQEARAIAAREQAAATRLRRLSQASLAIGAARTVDETLQTAVDEAVELFKADRASIDYLDGVNPEPRRLEAVAVLPDQHDAETGVGSEGNSEPQSEQIKHHVIVSAVPELQPVEPSSVQTPGHDDSGTHELGAALTGRDGSAAGHISVTSNRPFDEEDRSALTQLAHMVSVVLDNLALQREATGAAAALEADRLKGELLSTVSHELRTPLAAIKGFSSTLLMYFRRLPRAEQIAFLQEIDSAADRLTELVENLLQLSRLESGALKVEREPVALSGVLASAVEDARRRHTSREINFNPAPDLPVVLADQRRIRQVVSNLLENAVKFSPDGGAVTVAAHRAPDGSAEFSVADQGIGMPAAERERVFERFHRVTSGRAADIGGTGLGLAICRRIVEQHGGRITLTSIEGEGSTFTVTLPAITGSG